MQLSGISKFVPGKWVEMDGFKSESDMRGDVWGTTLIPVVGRDDVDPHYNSRRGGRVMGGGQSKEACRRRRQKLRRGQSY